MNTHGVSRAPMYYDVELLVIVILPSCTNYERGCPSETFLATDDTDKNRISIRVIRG